MTWYIATATGEMVALNATNGAVRWRTAVATFFVGGATIANDVVFGAGLDGVIHGFDTATGREIWMFQASAGINAPPAIAGDMLVVPAGGPLLAGATRPAPQPEVIAFRLGGATQMAATPVGATAVALFDAGGPL